MSIDRPTTHSIEETSFTEPKSREVEVAPNNPELMDAAKRLRRPRYFSAPTGADPLTQGREIFLVAAGVKPGAIVTNMYPSLRFRSKDRIDDDATAWLDSFGIAARLQRKGNGAASFYIAKTDPAELDAEVEYLEQLQGRAAAEATGRFLGYPRSAINAYAYDGPESLLRPEEQKRILAENGLPSRDFPFQFSQASWEEELEEYKHWYEVLDEYGLGKK